MKSSILALFAGLLLAVGAQAGTPGIVTVTGSIVRAVSPEGHCGASTYGYVVDGTYQDQTGVTKSARGCLDVVAVPVQSTIDAGKSYDLMTKAETVLKNASGKSVVMTFAVDDLEDVNSNIGTLLTIELQK